MDGISGLVKSSKSHSFSFLMTNKRGDDIRPMRELLNSKSEWHQAKIITTTTRVVQGGAESLRQGGEGGGGGGEAGGAGGPQGGRAGTRT